MKKYQFGQGQVWGVHNASIWAKGPGKDAIYMALEALGFVYVGPGDRGYSDEVFAGTPTGVVVSPCYDGISVFCEDSSVLTGIESVVADMAECDEKIDRKASSRRTTATLNKQRRHDKWKAQLKKG